MSNEVTAASILKSLALRSVVPPAVKAEPVIADLAIAGAKREKTVVKLGLDPAITAHAAEAVKIKAQIDKFTEDFSIYQDSIRQYGKDKRDIYNETFKSDVATVAIPYDENGETRYVQVTCSNRYSVTKQVVLNNQAELGEWFPALFTVETTKKLKGNSETLIRNLLGEMGLHGDQLEEAMNSLFETEQKVSTTPNYEDVAKSAPASVKTILDQAVTRASPALKF